MEKRMVKICSKCGSTDIEVVPLTEYAVGAPTKYICRNCGFSSTFFQKIPYEKAKEIKVLPSEKVKGKFIVERQFFNLQEGEKIIQDIKPLKKLRIYWFMLSLPTFIILFGVIWSVISGMLKSLQTIRSLGILTLTGLGNLILSILFVAVFTVILGIGISWLVASNRYKHQHYWITNKRIIYKRGLLGYVVTSIPLERISDVIISRTFFERIFGFGSLHIQSLAGQISGTHLGAEGVLLAIPNPEETQELIFKLLKEKRKEEKISF